MDIIEIKREIKRLKKLKRDIRPGSKERIEIFRKIKDLKKKITEINISEPGKDKIISEILRIEAEHNIKPKFEDLGIDLHKYTIQQLEFHLKRIKG